MIIKWKCKCMQDDGTVEVRDRREGEIITDWLEDAIQPALYAKHRLISPECTEEKVEHLKIPLDAVGDVVKQKAH